MLGRRGRACTLPAVRPPTWIEAGKLLAGRHPCAWTSETAAHELQGVLEHGVTLILDLTEEGELAPYLEHVPEPVRHVRIPVRDFTAPTREQIAEALDAIDAELERGGVVYVHCWAGCGRTGVVVGCWLVRHGTSPQEALARIAETRGLGCPQTLEQRLAVLNWQSTA
jgi:atypical dual specificity phosphatase